MQVHRNELGAGVVSCARSLDWQWAAVGFGDLRERRALSQGCKVKCCETRCWLARDGHRPAGGYWQNSAGEQSHYEIDSLLRCVELAVKIRTAHEEGRHNVGSGDLVFGVAFVKPLALHPGKRHKGWMDRRKNGICFLRGYAPSSFRNTAQLPCSRQQTTGTTRTLNC